jgi:hypothetical protein
MHRLATRELSLLGLGAVAVVLVLATLARSEEKSTPAIATVDGMPAVPNPSRSIVRLERDISALQSAAL